jgi:beta-lactamase regulating signal transducer with metallopeptidase domain
MFAEIAVAALEAAFRWTVPFAVAWLILRRGNFSAAARHHLWTVLLAGLLLLPVAVTGLPSYHVPRPTMLEPRVSATGVVQVDAAPRSSLAHREAGEGEGIQTDTRSPGLARTTPAPDAAVIPDGGDPRSVLRAVWPWIWLGGATGLLGFWLVGQFAVRSFASRSLVAPDPQVALLRACARRMGIRRKVRLLHSGQNLVPMTWGWLRPVVLLPASSVFWSQERLRRVLLHELAHVARFDSPVQSLARVTCSVFWFHPAAWYAARSMRREAEMACDDRVIEVEGTPFAYAEDLLRIAHTLGTVPLPEPALPMATRSGLDQRIRALLESGRRRGVSRRLAGIFALGAVALICAVAVVRWADSAVRGLDSPEDWLRRSALEDGRGVWTMACGSAGEAICVDGGRRAVALLGRTGRTGAVIAQRISTGEVVMYAAVRDPASDRSDAMPRVGPGSVAKLALAALWWESGLADSVAACPAETHLPSGRPLRNAGGYASGPVSAERMLVVSCNTAAVTMAARLIESHGTLGFARTLERMGFGASTSPSAEEPGPRMVAYTGVAPPAPVAAGAGRRGKSAEADDLLLLAGLGMSGSTTTPLQISQFLQAVGNGGQQLPALPVEGRNARVEPHQVVGQDAATRLQQAMLQVVGEGTAARALPQLEWSQWTLGGKTGTVPNGADDPNGWFAGLAYGPDGRAEYTIVVLIEGGGVGGGAPAGIAAEMTRLFARIHGDEL